MKRRMTREEILRDFGEAKARRHIYPHFQPQYTTEFDENGRPLKAYGSATLVVDD